MRMLILVGGFILGSLVPAQSTSEKFVGYLECSILSKTAQPVSSYNSLKCQYEKADGSVDYYEGYSGIISVDSFSVNRYSIVFEIFSMDVTGSGVLQGEYAIWRSGSGPEGQAYLSGGRDIILKPVGDTSLTFLSIASRLAGIAGLHLNYAGTIHKRARQTIE